MNLFGLQITTQKAATGQPTQGTGGWYRVSEPYAGAWQRNDEEKRGDVLTYPTLYACLRRVSEDIGKLPFGMTREAASGIEQPVDTLRVLNNPNGYQTAQQFREAWILSKLIHGNAYILKQRNNGGMISALYVMDPTRVLPLVSTSGEVFYQITYNSDANLLPESITDQQIRVPASEIIHDRMACFHHQLIGVPPVAAANWPTVKNLRILRNSAELFKNGAQMGGILSAPAGISEKDAKDLKEYWKSTTAKDVRVVGMDMKFTPFSMNSVDAQLVEQMEYSDRQICQPFGIPPFIVGIGNLPSGLKAEDMVNVYYRFALQSLIESMENLLMQGLRIRAPLAIKLDTGVLLRMDTERRATVYGGMIDAGIATINEARSEFNYPPLNGGDTVYRQQQDIPIDAPLPEAAPEPVVEPDPDEPDTEEAKKIFDESIVQVS